MKRFVFQLLAWPFWNATSLARISYQAKVIKHGSLRPLARFAIMKSQRFSLPTRSEREPLIYCDSGMQGKASRSETRGLSER